MSHAKLDIELARHPARFRPGEPIRGFIRARSEKPFSCERLAVAWAWVTTVPDRQRAWQQRTGSLELTSGPDARAEHRFPFEIAAPLGPFSFDGDLFRTTWFLSAIRGNRMLPSSYAQTDFELTPWMPGEMLGAKADYRVAPVAPPGEYEYGFLPQARRYLAAAPRLSFPAHARNAWGRLRSGSVHLECPSIVAAGERLSVRIHFRKGASARIAEVEVRLAGIERYDDFRPYDVIPNSRHYTRAAALQITDATPDPGFADGATDAWSAAFDVSLDAPPSLHTTGPSLCWQVEVHCRSKSTPERLLVKPLLVRPPRVERGSAAA